LHVDLSALTFQTTKNKFICQRYEEGRAFFFWLEKEDRDAKAAGQLPTEITPSAFSQLSITLKRVLAINVFDNA